MRYLTKEWYELSQQCDYHLLVKVSEKAAAFSEGYYQQLRKRKLRAFLKDQERSSRTPGILTIATMENADPGPGTEKMVEEGLLKREYLRQYPDGTEEGTDEEIMPIPYDEERETKLFQVYQERQISKLQGGLPPEILREVADIRVLAFNVATKEVKKAIRTWCLKNLKEVNRIAGQYPWIKELHDGFSFHDDVLLSIQQKEDELVLRLEQFGSVIFHDFRILEQDDDLERAWWLYEEVYPAENGNEYHVLLQRKGGQIAYLTILARKIELRSSCGVDAANLTDAGS